MRAVVTQGRNCPSFKVVVDWLWVRYPFGEMKYLFKLDLYFRRSGNECATLTSAIQHAMPTEFDG